MKYRSKYAVKKNLEKFPQQIKGVMLCAFYLPVAHLKCVFIVS